MSEEFRSEIEKILVKAWNECNLNGLDEIYSQDIIRHRPPLPDIEGLNDFKEYVIGFSNIGLDQFHFS